MPSCTRNSISENPSCMVGLDLNENGAMIQRQQNSGSGWCVWGVRAVSKRTALADSAATCRRNECWHFGMKMMMNERCPTDKKVMVRAVIVPAPCRRTPPRAAPMARGPGSFRRPFLAEARWNSFKVRQSLFYTG